MFHTFHKAGKKVAGIGAAIVLGVSCFAMTGCETSRPQVSITVSFNEETYVLNYELYRSCYPQTVTHYLELANAGYYDGLCVHNYTSAMLYTGGYTYDVSVKANGGLVEKNYFAIAPTLSLTQSVFDQATGEGTNTLYGEFTLNGYKVSNNAQRMKFGSLVMYYTEKTDDTVRVKTVRNDSNELNENMKYKYNSATSLFAIFTGTASTHDSEYCTFGQLLDKASSDALTDLTDAIEEYIDSLDDEEYTTEVSLRVDSYDPYSSVERNSATYQVPSMPIIIESVKVLKY